MSEIAVRNVLIIGSGPAGLTASIYAARANLKPLLIEGFAGGASRAGSSCSRRVENYPGFPTGSRPQLMQHFRDQSSRQGTEMVTATLTRRSPARPFTVWAERRQGIQGPDGYHRHRGPAKWLGCPARRRSGQGRERLRGVRRGLLPRPGRHRRGRRRHRDGRVDVPSGLCKTVTLVHRREEFRASKTMQARVLANPKIKPMLNSAVEEFLDVSKGEVTGARARSIETGAVDRTSRSPALFVAIGHTPNTDLSSARFDLPKRTTCRTKPGTAPTNVPGVFACWRCPRLHLSSSGHGRG